MNVHAFEGNLTFFFFFLKWDSFTPYRLLSNISYMHWEIFSKLEIFPVLETAEFQ